MKEKNRFVYIIICLVLILAASNFLTHSLAKGKTASKTSETLDGIDNLKDMFAKLPDLNADNEDGLLLKISELENYIKEIEVNLEILNGQVNNNVIGTGQQETEFNVEHYMDILNNDERDSPNKIYSYDPVNGLITIEPVNGIYEFGNQDAFTANIPYRDVIKKYENLFIICESKIQDEYIEEAGFESDFIENRFARIKKQNIYQDLEACAIQYKLLRTKILSGIEKYEDNAISKDELERLADEYNDLIDCIIDMVSE